jgi:hypothetical protein
MYWPDFDYEQLFDLKEDPGEINDLRNSTNPKHQQQLDNMRTRFNQLKQLVNSDEIVTI